MSSEISYSINGKPCSGKEYLGLIEEVFNRRVPDVENIKLQNGEIISFGGNEACVSILHHKHDGTVWTPSKSKNTKEDAIILLGAFIQGDEATLSSFGASLSSSEQHKGIDFSEGSKIDQKLKRLFLVFLVLGAISAIIWSLIGASPVFLAPVFLFAAVACVCFMIGGIAYLIGTYKYHLKFLKNNRKVCTSWQMVFMYCFAGFSIIFVFLFGVLFPACMIVFLIWQIFRLF